MKKACISFHVFFIGPIESSSEKLLNLINPCRKYHDKISPLFSKSKIDQIAIKKYGYNHRMEPK